MELVTKVFLYRSPYTICYMTKDRIILPDSQSYKSIGIKRNASDLNVGDHIEVKSDLKTEASCKRLLKLNTSALFLQPFLKECINSDVYRINVIRYINKLSGYPNSGTVFLKLILEPPDKEVIDYAW